MKPTALIPIAALLLASFASHADILHHWALDETTGGTATDSVGTNDGIWQDGTDTNLTWEAGMIGNAAHLNDAGGQIQHFDVGVISTLAGATQISISLWFNPDGQTDYNGLFTSRTESNAGSWSVAWEGGNHADFHTAGTGNQTDSGSTLSAGNWYHVLAVWDNDTGNRTVYINGDPAGTGASVAETFTDGTAFAGDGTWFIGTDNCCSNDRDFDGLIDDLAVFDTALTAADAATIYTAGLAGINVVLALSPAPDVDGDGLDDPWEDKYFGDGDGTATTTELALQDGDDDGYPIADGDGLDNAGEQAAGTDPNVADSDTDGINDGDEVSGAQNPYKVGHIQGEPPGGTPGAPTNPRNDDSDNDTILDGEELVAGTDGFVTNPNDGDTDGDLMGDLYEITNNLGGGLDPTDASDDVTDLDGDTIDNIDEHDAIPQTRADKADTDDDGYDDPVEDLFGSWGSETTTGTDPTNPDSDGDGLLDGQENLDLAAHNPPNQYKTDPNIFDSDEDTYGDGAEVTAGTDPDDINDFPPGNNRDFETGDLSAWSALAWSSGLSMTIDSVTQLAGDYSLTTGSDAINRSNTQNTGTFTDFSYSMLFRLDSLGTGGTARGMDWNLSPTLDGNPNADLRFKVDPGGIFGIALNGGDGWTAPLDDTTSLGFVPTEGTTYRWEIDGTGFDGSSSASFDMRIFDSATEVFTSTGNTFTSGIGDSIESVNFIRGANWGSGGFTVDDISIAPSTTTDGLRITGSGFDGSDNFYIDVEGGVAGRKVTSADDLDFTNEVDVTTTNDGNNRFFISPANRNATEDFFRIKEAP